MPQFASSPKAIASHHAPANNHPRPANTPDRDGESPFASMLDSATPAQDHAPHTPVKTRDDAPRSERPERSEQSPKNADAKADNPDKSAKSEDAKASDDKTSDADAASATDSTGATDQTTDAKDSEDAKAAEALAAALEGKTADAAAQAATSADASTADTTKTKVDATAIVAATVATVADPAAPAQTDALKAEIDADAEPKATFAGPIVATQLAKTDTDTKSADAADTDDAKLARVDHIDLKQASGDLKKPSVATAQQGDPASVHRHSREDLPPQAVEAQANGATKVSSDPVQIALPAQAAHSTPQNNVAQANGLAQLQQPAAVPIQGLGVEIASKALAGKNRFEIRLDPPELGRIDVRLDVDRQGQVTSRLVVDRADTLDLLRRDAASLERALQDAGLKTDGNSLQFSLRDQPTYRDGNQEQAPNAAQLVIPDDSLPAIETTQRYARLASLRGGLDIRV